MTTPAVSYSGTGKPVTRSLVAWNGSSFSTVDSVRKSEHRPASVSVPKEKSGWRPPASFNHDFSWYPLVPDLLVTGHYQGNKNWWFTESNRFTLPEVILQLPPSFLYQRAVQQAYGNLKNQRVNLAVAFAERKETAELFTSVVERIAKSVRAFKSRRFGDFIKATRHEGKRSWRKTPQSWLELQYGWNPLMQDVQGACSALSAREANANAYVIKARGYAHTNQEQKDSYTCCSLATNTAFFDRFLEFNYQEKVVLYYKVVGYLARDLSQLGLTNPAEVIWERLPYSFVVDWFLPVGSWLSGFDSDLGLQYLAGCRTSFSKMKVRGSARAAANQNTVDLAAGSANGFAWRMNRVTLPEPPGLGFPSFKNPFSSVHIANAMSLLSQAFRH